MPYHIRHNIKHSIFFAKLEINKKIEYLPRKTREKYRVDNSN